jgi:hypothetical protein
MIESYELLDLSDDCKIKMSGDLLQGGIREDSGPAEGGISTN